MEITRHWRLKAQRYRLEGSMCLTCGQLIFPPRPICTSCTDQRVRIAGSGIQVLPASMNTSDIESRIQYEITEMDAG